MDEALFDSSMEPILILIGVLGVIGGIMIPLKCQRIAFRIVFPVAFLGAFAVIWIIYGPRDYLLWMDGQWYQTIFHPWMLALFGIPTALIFGSIFVGLLMKRIFCNKQ